MPRSPGGKSALIRSLPISMTAKQVVEEARRRGVKLSTNLVYVVRSTSNGKPARTARPRATNTEAKQSPERRFAELVLEMGIPKMRELLDRAERSVRRVIMAGR